MKYECEINVNGQKIKAVKEYYKHGLECLEIVRFTFFHNKEMVGGFLKTIFDENSSLIKERIKWELKDGKKGKYNRYFLTKMAHLTDEKIKEGEIYGIDTM